MFDQDKQINKYYRIAYANLPGIRNSDVVPGTILIGTRPIFSVCSFPDCNLLVFKSDTDTATVISILKNKQLESLTFPSENYDMILLNNTQNRLFVSSLTTFWFAKLDS